MAHRLLDRVEHQAHIDLIADFAAPLTFRLICAVLGVPEHLDTASTPPRAEPSASPAGSPITGPWKCS
ncbi:hypothetical protein [Streptomyces sp. HNM0645]|uniref:hypothetical protein n=1 Tax=Streptomyces sp. HNM0645 TaxID=2782343 RepID=UPI0024B6B50D|nr:hypothetical protein [Streptomyces sp. HNM0645]